MAQYHTRRSRRVDMAVPIRVYGIDYRGVDFTEDASTLNVNRHGAKIRMSHQLLPDSEIRLFSQSTGHESIFRVVGKLRSSEPLFSYWGVENLHPEKNIWGVDLPETRHGEQLKVLVTLQCPNCAVHESLRADATLMAALLEKGGIQRTCSSCHTSGVWKLLPFNSA